jgi:hypothetical protein
VAFEASGHCEDGVDCSIVADGKPRYSFQLWMTLYSGRDNPYLLYCQWIHAFNTVKTPSIIGAMG